MSFILEGISVIRKYNYFYISGNFIHQIKGTAMAINAAVVQTNLTGGYLEVELFNNLSEIFSYDTVEFFLKNYFRFLDLLKCSWKESIDVLPLWELMNSLHPDFKFVCTVCTVANFLDASSQIKNYQLI